MSTDPHVDAVVGRDALDEGAPAAGKNRGWLRIYLGAAPGVGKTYAMLNEGTRRHERGTDVVIGVVETHGRPHTIEQIGDLEVVPRRQVDYRGRHFEEMDLPAILARAPSVVLVDELAHTNAPGVEHEKRWEDVEALMDAGINVISTLNLQHLESVNDVVETITGVVQRETVPDAQVRKAEQIELVDMTPEALRRRLAHGNVYPADRIDAALTHFFRLGNLAALRELALLWLADRVDEELTAYRERHGIQWSWETKERVVVSITGATGSERLIRRAARMAARSKAELVGVTVRVEDSFRGGSNEGIARNVELLEELGGRYIEVVGTDVASALVSAARAENATQLVIGATRRSWRDELFRGSVVARCVREARGEIDIHVIGAEGLVVDEKPPPTTRRRISALPRRRVVAAVVFGLIAFPLITWLLVISASPQSLPLALSSYLLVVIAVAALGGLWPGLAAAGAAFLISNWEFAQPLHTLTIADPRDILALISFFVAAITVSTLVDLAARRSAAAMRAEREARALARVASRMSGEEGALQEIVTDIVRIFELDGAALRTVDRRKSGEDIVVGVLGDSATSVELDQEHVLSIDGRTLDPESAELLRGITRQLVAALERYRFERESHERDVLRRSDDLRAALLSAVSRDLRQPLARIEDAAAALREVSDASQAAPLAGSIEREAARLEALVEDVNDMSRVHGRAVAMRPLDVELCELVDGAIHEAIASAGAAPDSVTRTGEQRVELRTDPVLVRRVIANLVSNALLHGQPSDVIVDVGRLADDVSVRVIDHGPGVRGGIRDDGFEPFHRRVDAEAPFGAGLGLAIAQGFCDVLGGELSMEDIPGGGCTMVVNLPTRGTEPEVGS